MDNKTDHHICLTCGWGSSTVVCKRCGTEHTPPVALVKEVAESFDKPSKPDDMSWFVF